MRQRTGAQVTLVGELVWGGGIVVGLAVVKKKL